MGKRNIIIKMQDITDGFDPGDDKKVIEILKKWKGGRISTPLFTTLANMLPTPCLETVVLRNYNHEVQILLVPRPTDDIIWPGMIHSPGGALRHLDYLRPDDNPFKGVFARVETEEIKNKFLEDPQYVATYNLLTKRGPEFTVVFLAKIAEDAILPDGAGWYDINKLAEVPNFLVHQMKAIQAARVIFDQI